MRYLAALAFFAVASAGAQTPAPQAMLDELVANAAQYSATLPSLTADETIESEASWRGILPDKVRATGTFRAIRKAPGEPLEESRQLATVNGKPVDPDHKVRLPFTLFGGFGRFQEMFFTPNHIHCYSFTMLTEHGPGNTLKIAIAAPKDLDGPTCGQDRAGLTGMALVDPATHQLVHLERTVPENPANKSLAPFAAVDCAPTKVGDDTFWLPTMVTGAAPKRTIRGVFTAHYSNYHRFAATITVLPGATEVDTPAPADPTASSASTPR